MYWTVLCSADCVSVLAQFRAGLVTALANFKERNKVVALPQFIKEIPHLFYHVWYHFTFTGAPWVNNVLEIFRGDVSFLKVLYG